MFFYVPCRVGGKNNVHTESLSATYTAIHPYRGMCSRAPQLEKDFHGNGDGGKTSQNDPLGLGPTGPGHLVQN